jgi:hypothetical protein
MATHVVVLISREKLRVSFETDMMSLRTPVSDVYGDYANLTNAEYFLILLQDMALIKLFPDLQ